MYKIYFKQAVQMLKQNKFISIVSILGTAMAIMMIMAMVVAEEVKTVNIAPESNRDRMLYVTGETSRDTVKQSMSSGYLTYLAFQKYISKLKTPEAVGMIGAYEIDHAPTVVSVEGSPDRINMVVRPTNADYWKVLDFTFLEGKPYSGEEYGSGMKYAVLTATKAKELFKGESALNKMIDVNFTSYKVVGVVKDVSPVLRFAYSDVWLPSTSMQNLPERFGVRALILAKDKNDFAQIIQEVRQKEKQYTIDNSPAATVYFLGPMDSKSATAKYFIAHSVEDHENDKIRIQRSYVSIMLILLLIPAINLSGFSLSRIKKRTPEIGVRKAFGAKKYIILIQVLYENMITSLIGGVIGLMLSYLAVYSMKEWLLGVPPDANIPIEGLISPWVFIATFFICLFINLISAGIPAYRASKMSIVDSLTQNDKQ